MATSGEIVKTVGSNAAGNYYQPWPQTWPQTLPQTWTYPSYNIWQYPAQDYANEVEVERGEHDAVLRFYRTRGTGRSMVKEITVPIGVLDWLTKPQRAAKK